MYIHIYPFVNAFSIFISNGDVMYLLAKLKPSEQKEHFSQKEQNELGGI